MDFFGPSSSSSTSPPPPTMHDSEAHTLTQATQEENLRTEQDSSRQQIPDTPYYQHVSAKIKNISSKAQDLVYEIGESRDSDLKKMDNLEEMIMAKAKGVCEAMKEHMYAMYERNNHAMNAKLQELSEVLGSSSRLNEEVQEVSQALDSLRKGLDLFPPPEH